MKTVCGIGILAGFAFIFGFLEASWDRGLAGAALMISAAIIFGSAIVAAALTKRE